MAKSEATVEELVNMIKRGELRLPEMQRRYVWRATRVRDLFDSLYRGYPSGAILLWETDEAVPQQDWAVDQAFNPYASTRLLLDGQQRLTSLSAIIRGEPLTVRGRRRPIELLFNLEHPEELSVVTEVDEDSHEEMDDDVQSDVNDESDVDLVDDDEADSTEDELQSRFDRMTFVVGTKKLARLPHWVKVSEVFKTNEDAPFLAQAGIELISDPRYSKYSQRLARLRNIRNYSYRMDVLERSMTYDEVTEIFVRVNSLGAKLRGSDLALAQITAKWRGALEEFEDYERKCTKSGFEVELGVHLRNLVAFATGQSRFLTIGSVPLETLQTAWAECQSGMDFAINYLKSNLQIDSPALLSSPYLLVTTAFFAHKRNYEISPEDSAKFRYWALCANAKGRYSRGSSESLLDQDLATIRNGESADALVDRLRNQMGRLDVSAGELAGRNQRSALFKTMFLAFRESGAKDWNSNLAIALTHSGQSHKLQFHHIFPKALLTSAGRTAAQADDIANLAFIGGTTNRKISATPPSTYIKTMIEKSGPEIFAAQCIPVEDELLQVDNYDAFLARRRELLADRLNTFLGSHTGDAPLAPIDPQVRDLDQLVESVELKLRRLIANEAQANESSVPPHVDEKIRSRMADAVRKNPASVGKSPSLEEQLQYADFRDLQDIVTAKTLWTGFESTFGTKEVFNSRCAQLAELRNAIRHSRDLNDVTRKDGEAALLWFQQQLTQ